MKRIITIALILISALASAQQKYDDGIYSNQPIRVHNVRGNRAGDYFSCGFSYSFNNTFEIWASVWKIEASYFFNPSSERIPELNRNGVHWTDYKLTEFRGFKVGYQFLSYLSFGATVSWKDESFDYSNGYCLLHHENHKWISGYAYSQENIGVGLYAKIGIPLKELTPFLVGQVSTNGNHLIGIGVLLNIT